jgi:CRP-like cAMP-binding protein
MSLKDEVELLRQVPLFCDIPPARIKLLAFTSDKINYAAGQVLFNQGDQGDAAYVLLSGTVDVLIDSPGGQIKIGTVGPNAIVGEIAILCDVVRTATIKSTTPVEALRIRKDYFLKLLADFPEMTIEIIRVLAGRLNQTTAALTEARSKLMQLGENI